MEFITQYRQALWEIKNGLSNDGTDEKLRQLIDAENAEIKKAIYKSRKTGRGALLERLREYVTEERYAWSLTQYLKDNVENMDTGPRRQEAWLDFIREIYYVSNDAIEGLLELLADYYPDKLCSSIALFSGAVPIPELIEKFGSVPAKRILKSKMVLLSTADGADTRAFDADHADRLLKYPGTEWRTAADNAVIAPTERPSISVEDFTKHVGCRCYRQEDAERVEDLCPECPIVAMLNDPLATAHVRAEMREIKELKLPEQYQQYCSEKLEHHASLAAQLASEMNRTNGWNHARMESKFYNRAVAKLYRNELLPPSAQKEPASKSSKIKAKSPISDILRYFPALAPTLGNQPTDESVLADLALWLMHWFERNKKFSDTPRYTLLGKMQQQQRAATDRVKFLNACERLREALTALLATELSARHLLNTMFTTERWQDARDAVNWWAGWIREQREITPPVRTLADAYLEALQRIPLAVEWVNRSPRYIVQARLDSTGFAADIRALREGFETTIRTLQPVALRTLRTQFGKLLKVDQERIKRCRESFERQEYSLEFLAEEFDALRFEVADNPDGLTQWQWVGPTFWADINVLVQYKQEAARSAFEVLNDALEAPSAQQSTASNNTPIPANYWLAEWRHFFPGDASRFDDLLENIVDFFRGCEQHEFDSYDILLVSLEHTYRASVEQERFLALITNVVPLLEQELSNRERGLAAFASFGTGGLWGDGQGECSIPANGWPINNLLRVRGSLTRVRRWLKVRQLTPAEQLLNYLTTIPVVRWSVYPKGDSILGLETTLSIPLDAAKDANQAVEMLWLATQKELRSINDGQRKVLSEQLLRGLKHVEEFLLSDIDALESRSPQPRVAHDAARLPEYFPRWKWGDMHENSQGKIDSHFWHFLKLAIGTRQAWAKNLCREIAEVYTSLSYSEPLTPPKRTPATREQSTAKIHNSVKLDEIRNLLTEVGMGTTFVKPGEWAAAFRALHIKQVLVGQPAAVHRWAARAGYDTGRLSTMKTPWLGEGWNQAGQFKNADEQAVFKKATTLASKLLADRGKA